MTTPRLPTRPLNPNSWSARIREADINIPAELLAEAIGCTTNLVRVVRHHMRYGRDRTAEKTRYHTVRQNIAQHCILSPRAMKSDMSV